MPVPCLDGAERPYRDLDCAASTPALQSVADRVNEFLPWYSSVHRGAGYKSRRATAAYEAARDSVHRFARRPAGGDDVVVLVRNTTEAINHLAYRLGLGPDDVVATTVVEHHANLLPWARVATRRWVECGPEGTFDTGDVVRVLEDGRRAGPPGPDRRLQRHRLAAPGRGDLRRGPRPRCPGPARRGPAGAAPSPAGGARLRRLQRPQALRTLRRRRAHRAAPGLRARRPLPGRRRRGRPGRPRRGHLDGTARARGGGLAQRRRRGRLRRRPWTSWSGSAGTPSWPTRASLAARLTRGCGPSTACAVLGPWSETGAPTTGCRGDVHRGRDAPRPRGGPAQRRVRDRRAARLLLRAPLPHPPARRRPPGCRPGPRRRAAR